MRVVLVQSEARGARTEGGDSGSPVVTADGRTLLGMHIAGDGERSFMIPAFELLRTGNYVGLLPGGKLRLTPL